jgi:hypothetical protein
LPTKAAAAAAQKGRSTPAPRSGSGQAPVKSNTTLRHATGESAVVSDEAFPVRRSRAPVVAAIMLLAVAGGGIAWMMNQDQPGHPPSSPTVATIPDEQPGSAAPKPVERYHIEIVTEPRGAAINLDGRYVGSGTFNDELPRDGSKHTIVARAVGYREAEVTFTDRSPPRQLALEPIRVPTTAELPRPAASPSGKSPVRSGGAVEGHKRSPSRATSGSESASEAGRRPSTKAPANPARTKAPALPNGAPIIE